MTDVKGFRAKETLPGGVKHDINAVVVHFESAEEIAHIASLYINLADDRMRQSDFKKAEYYLHIGNQLNDARNDLLDSKENKNE